MKNGKKGEIRMITLVVTLVVTAATLVVGLIGLWILGGFKLAEIIKKRKAK